jgi:hypothetical protein
VLPKENENDIEEIPALVRADLEFIPATHVDEVLFEALDCEGPARFKEIIEGAQQRDEKLFTDPKREDEDGNGKEKSNVVTH